jgi:hypothetical protein
MHLKNEWPVGVVSLVKTKAHQTHKAVEGKPFLQWQKVGNDMADIQAKLGARLHISCPAEELRTQRAEALVTVLSRFFAAALSFLTRFELMPLCPVAAFRIPKMPAHSIVVGPGGVLRCVRCFRIANRSCPLSVACVPRGFASHLPVSLGGGLFCSRCGAYSYAKTVKLAGACLGKPASDTVARRLKRMLLGVHPISGVFLGVPSFSLLPGDLFEISM